MKIHLEHFKRGQRTGIYSLCDFFYVRGSKEIELMLDGKWVKRVFFLTLEKY